MFHLLINVSLIFILTLIKTMNTCIIFVQLHVIHLVCQYAITGFKPSTSWRIFYHRNLYKRVLHNIPTFFGFLTQQKQLNAMKGVFTHLIKAKFLLFIIEKDCLALVKRVNLGFIEWLLLVRDYSRLGLCLYSGTSHTGCQCVSQPPIPATHLASM